jgi:hypothetical protein
MDIVSSALKTGTAGETICTGSNKKLWVWHNRIDWTNKKGTSYTVSGIPANATRLDVYRYNSWSQPSAGDPGTPMPYLSYTLSGQTSYTINNLPTEETLMFLAVA